MENNLAFFQLPKISIKSLKGKTNASDEFKTGKGVGGVLRPISIE